MKAALSALSALSLENVTSFARDILRLHTEVKLLRAELDNVRSRAELGDAFQDAFRADRHTDAYRSVFSGSRESLVSVCVGTYNRAATLVERCVRSILEQDYKNLQILVIGDACTDETERRMAMIRDTRLHFENLTERGCYPEVQHWRWMVAGTAPFNRALELAEGDFITHLDDDDEYLPGRVGRLVAFAKETHADVVYHPFWYERKPGVWAVNPASRFSIQMSTTSSVLYHRWFKRIPWDLDAYRNVEPGDANRFRKFRYLGAEAHRYEEPLLRKYHRAPYAE
jgi:hypothetical protein